MHRFTTSFAFNPVYKGYVVPVVLLIQHTQLVYEDLKLGQLNREFLLVLNDYVGQLFMKLIAYRPNIVWSEAYLLKT